MQRVIVFALETGMRAGEIAALSHSDIRGNVAVLKDTKNGTSREVPLSEKALGVLGLPVERASAQHESVGLLPQVKSSGKASATTQPQSIFNLTAGTISTRFRELCKETGIKGLSFHCLRRTAATRLSKKLDVWQLCAMFGWKDPRIPLKHYYRQDAAEIAARLDS